MAHLSWLVEEAATHAVIGHAPLLTVQNALTYIVTIQWCLAVWP